MTSELKPCPFCGWDGELIEDGGKYYIECENSACPPQPTTPLVDSVDTAVEDWNTRTAPDVPELVRYDCVAIGGIDAEMTETTHGEYVRYDQAAAIITAERQRAEAAEAKLAEYEKQEPVAWASFNDDGNMVHLTRKPIEGLLYTPLYASPAPMPSHDH